MHPWERRLKDLAQLLANCATTYFDPELFRMNTNQFLQTSRTVTFIIQKNKASIPDYEKWYDRHVINAWQGDAIMRWAKESRNVVEKEGDLSLHSTLRVTLLFSYLEEEDIFMDCGRSELLTAGIKKLVRFAQQKLPTGVSDAGVVKIERRWVASSLPTWELLHAMSYIYTRMVVICESLASHLGSKLDSHIPEGTEFDWMREQARQVKYIKLRGLQTYQLASNRLERDPKYTPPEDVSAAVGAIGLSSRPTNLGETIQLCARVAQANFEHFGDHVPMLFAFDKTWKPIDQIAAHFTDQAEKFIFWRSMAERLARLKAFGVVWICESWLRKTDYFGVDPIRKMPIVGEQLHVLGIDSQGNTGQISWDIKRTHPDGPPTLVAREDENQFEGDGLPFYLVPVMRALGDKRPNPA